jgi:hypothetical protein
LIRHKASINDRAVCVRFEDQYVINKTQRSSLYCLV